MAILTAYAFSVEITFKNDIVCISVTDDAYSGRISLNYQKQDFASFVSELTELFQSLHKGTASLEEYYEPEENFIAFESDGMCHFNVNGILNNWGNWTLKFSKTIDQSYFKNFIRQLQSEI